MPLRRVAVISYHSSPLLEPGSGDAGGMTVYVREVARAMAQQGVATDIFTRAVGDAPRICELIPGVRVVSLEAGPRTGVEKENLPSFLEEFVQGARAFSTSQRIAYEIVHSHYWQSGLVAKTLSSVWNAPHVHSHHTLGKVKNRWLVSGDSPEPQSRLDGEEEVIGAADVLVASTDEEWSQLSCLYGASHDRLKVVHPGVDHSLFRPGDPAEARAWLGIDGQPVILYAGRIQPLKGLDLAVRAVRELVQTAGPVTLLIVGGASGRAGERELVHLKDLANSLGVAKHVRFIGAQPHARLPYFYSAADVVVVCSHSESFGLAALEAHACGTPVVGTAVGGLSYVVQDGLSGFLVDTREPGEFASRLRTILNDPELRHDFGEIAIKSAGAFSWERATDSFLELYECLVTERSPEVCTC